MLNGFVMTCLRIDGKIIRKAHLIKSHHNDRRKGTEGFIFNQQGEVDSTK